MVSCVGAQSEQQNLNIIPPDFEVACFEKIQSINFLICLNEIEDAEEKLAELVVYILTSKEISLTTAERHQLIESALYSFLDPENPYASNQDYREGFKRLSRSDQSNYRNRGYVKQFREYLLDASNTISAKDAEEALKYADLHSKFFSLKILPIKTATISHVELNKPIVIFNDVFTDGLGDFAIARSLVQSYQKNFTCQIHLIVSSTPEQLAILQRVFSESIQQLQSQGNLTISWKNAATYKEPTAQERQNAFFVAASTGYHYFREGSYVDCLHEMSPPKYTSGDIENEYVPSRRLALRLGFTPSSAGVFLPEKTKISLEQALEDTGLSSVIPLDGSDITIMYMKQNQEKYIAFMSKYAEQTNRTIHIIVPGNAGHLNNPNPDRLKLHHCPLIEQHNFQALVQHATVPPGTTGNETFLDALVGEIPFFFDGRPQVLPAIREFADYCSDRELEPATKEYLEFMIKMASTPDRVGEREMESMASTMCQNSAVIRRDLSRICDHVRANCNAETLVCNRLYERAQFGVI